MQPYLDFHTHRSIYTQNELGIQNLHLHIKLPELSSKRWYSAGIHPWYASVEQWEGQWQNLQKYAVLPEVRLIGECGLDRLRGEPLDKQLYYFEQQVVLAQNLHKPVVIHCVKAYSELLQWHKHFRPTVPLIVHGFDSKLPIAESLLEKGFYFSLGKALLKPNSNAQRLLAVIPLERLFLETDDSTTVHISEIYAAAAQILNLSLEKLISQIWHNFEGLF
ncbi:MAG: TatD family hydrolase [Runella sp.]